MSEVRRERSGIKKEVPAPTSAHANALQKVNAARGVVTTRPGMTVPKVEEVAEVKSSYVRPARIEEMVNESTDRLAKELKLGLNAPWSGQDEFFLMYILYEEGYLKTKRSATNPNFWKDIKSSDYKFMMSTYREAARTIEQKLKKLGIFEHYEEMK